MCSIEVFYIHLFQLDPASLLSSAWSIPLIHSTLAALLPSTEESAQQLFRTQRGIGHEHDALARPCALGQHALHPPTTKSTIVPAWAG
jgi:hypothetical protein